MAQFRIDNVADLGVLLRLVRKASKIRLDDLAATAGVSKQFVADVEHGKATVQMGRTLKLIGELGIRIEVDVPVTSASELERMSIEFEARRTRTEP